MDIVEIGEKWARLIKVMKDIENRGEEVILIGDQNKMIGNVESGIQNNNPKVNFGGKLVLELLAGGDYFLVNSSDNCHVGSFTREEPNNPNCKSCLDLVIVSKGLVEYIVELIIDKEKNFTPHRMVNGKKLIYADHYTLHFILRGMPMKNPKMKVNKSEVIWNTNKPGGWSKYKEMTENNTDLDSIAESAENLTSNEIMTRLENKTSKIKYRSFGKVKNSRGMENDKELEVLYSEKTMAASSKDIQEVEDKIAGKLLEKQRKEYEN